MGHVRALGGPMPRWAGVRVGGCQDGVVLGLAMRSGALGDVGAGGMWVLVGLGLYYYGDDHGAAAVVVTDPLADDAAG